MTNRYMRSTLTGRQKDRLEKFRREILKIHDLRDEIASRSYGNENIEVIVRLRRAAAQLQEALILADNWVGEQ